VDSNH